MKNLKLLWNYVNKFDSLENEDKIPIGFDDEDLFCLRNGNITFISPSKRIYRQLDSFRNVLDDPDKTKVIGVFYDPILHVIYIGLNRGDIVFIPYQSEINLDVINFIDINPNRSGLQVMEWSPDMETIVFITYETTLIVLDANFELIIEVDILDNNVSELEMVNVGWGSKETQFHGSAGKQAAKIIQEIPTQENIFDDKKPRISWRGDSSLFVVSYFCEELKIRRIKIFNRQGILQSIGEKLNGLNEPIAWRPSGNLIAITQTLPNKYVVCLIEKNGLRHGDFTLPPDIRVKELSWNSESTILCAQCIDKTTQNDCILLWTCSNHCWMLKQRLNFESPIVGLQWNNVVGNRLYIMLKDGHCVTYHWTWTIDHSYGLGTEDMSIIAVIDGCDIKLTPFKKMIVPPPMCGSKVTLPSTALQVMFAPYIEKELSHPECGSGCNSNNLCVYMTNHTLAFISQADNMAGAKLERIVGIELGHVLPSTHTTPLIMSHWAWIGPDSFLCVIQTDSGETYLCDLKLELERDLLVLVDAKMLEDVVITISPISGQRDEAVIQLGNRKLLKYTKVSELISMRSELCDENFVNVQAGGGNVYALTNDGKLYINEKKIANNVTSFFYYPPFLIVTLTQHKLRVLKIKSDCDYKDENDKGALRQIEHNSKIIVALDDTVVLQAPRGNLETIQPRALTLLTAARMLDSGDYLPLSKLLRRQRIDLNLCVDHNPSLFLLSITRFVQQIHNPQWLCVFLSELNDGDTTKALYSAFYDQTTRPPSLVNKVERVCTAIRSAMSQSDEDKEFYIFPILITHVKVGEIMQALNLANTDKALSYLTLLLDTDTLYEEALAAYNLEKALKIAAKSQKDPKEYVAYLNELRRMEPNYMKYTINKHLRKYSSALRYLTQCQGDRVLQECLDLIREHSLYAPALQLFQDQQERYKAVALEYAEILLTKCKYEEAGLMFLRSGEKSKSIEAYTRAGDWRQCVLLAKQCNFSDNELQQLYKALLDILKSHESFKDASELSRELMKDIDTAVLCLVDGRHWVEAIYLSEINQRTDLIDKFVKPGVQETASSLLTEMKTHRELLEKHSSRLMQVRQDKLNRINNPNSDAMSDIQSETGSISSFNTSSTGGSKSTKNRRKLQRKMWSLKEGNPREEQALLSEITQSVQAVYKMTGEVRSTCTILVRFNLDEKANHLQLSLTSTLAVVERIKASVWSIKNASQEEDNTVAQMDAQLNFAPTNCVAPQWQLDMFNVQ